MTFEVRDLGRATYSAVAAEQRLLLEGVADGSRSSTLLLVEHDPVITLGAGARLQNLLLTETEYAARGIEIQPSERGGDVTYHGPGQLVAYPVFSIEEAVGRDLHRWLRDLEQGVIVCLKAWNIVGDRRPPHTGVWVGSRKICAIGIKVRRWVSMHGLALNCDLNLDGFSLIVPCGIADLGVTSISEEAGKRVTVEEAKPQLVQAFRQVFHARRTPGNR